MIQFLSTDYFVSPRDLVAGEEQLAGKCVAGLPMLPMLVATG